MTTTVTITVANGVVEQTFTRRTVTMAFRPLGDTPRREAARLLVAAFADAAKLYRKEIAEDVAATRVLLDARVAAGLPVPAGEEAEA